MRLRGMRRSGMRRLVVEQLESRWLLSQMTGASTWDTLAETRAAALSAAQLPAPAVSSSRATDFGSPRSAPRLNADAEGESSNPHVPVLVGPTTGSVLAESRAVLTWKPLPGYTGPYMVRLHDTQWNGQQRRGSSTTAKCITCA